MYLLGCERDPNEAIFTNYTRTGPGVGNWQWILRKLLRLPIELSNFVPALLGFAKPRITGSVRHDAVCSYVSSGDIKFVDCRVQDLISRRQMLDLVDLGRI